MTPEAHHNDELHRLVDRLDRDQADAVRAVVLQLVAKGQPAETSDVGQHEPRRGFSFAGSLTAEPDFAERSEEILEEIHREYAV